MSTAPSTISHPIEDFLDIEPGSTMQAIHEAPEQTSALIDPTSGEVVERPTTELAKIDFEREERIEDLQVDAQLGEVHTAAMQAFYQQSALAQQVDPKFSARNSEVAAQFLNIALSTVSARVDAKHKRIKARLEKQKLTDGAPNSVQNNIIVADRNSLMQTLFAEQLKTVAKAVGEDEA
jgi:hypothetical protein